MDQIRDHPAVRIAARSVETAKIEDALSNRALLGDAFAVCVVLRRRR
jgi:hypothetical protein